MTPSTKELIIEILEEFIESAGGYLEYDLKKLDVAAFEKALKEVKGL
jgi:hypothetical protein